VFVRPEWRFSTGAKVPGLDGEKMSKSYDNAIPIFLPDDMTDKQAWKTYFASIKTDSRWVEAPKDPDDTLMTLYRLLAPSESGRVRGGLREGRRRLRRTEEALA
jgi:tryptophanyl-tRNA synthetase